MNTTIITVSKPKTDALSATTTHKVGSATLVVGHSFECELDECDGVAKHISKVDGAKLCDVCEEIEYDQLH